MNDIIFSFYNAQIKNSDSGYRMAQYIAICFDFDIISIYEPRKGYASKNAKYLRLADVYRYMYSLQNLYLFLDTVQCLKKIPLDTIANLFTFYTRNSLSFNKFFYTSNENLDTLLEI